MKDERLVCQLPQCRPTPRKGPANLDYRPASRPEPQGADPDYNAPHSAKRSRPQIFPTATGDSFGSSSGIETVAGEGAAAAERRPSRARGRQRRKRRSSRLERSCGPERGSVAHCAQPESYHFDGIKNLFDTSGKRNFTEPHLGKSPWTGVDSQIATKIDVYLINYDSSLLWNKPTIVTTIQDIEALLDELFSAQGTCSPLKRSLRPAGRAKGSSQILRIAEQVVHHQRELNELARLVGLGRSLRPP
jgi:hypothetical protein